MSILDMDVTARRNTGSIRNREFAIVRKGYDPDQVRAFVDYLASWIDDLRTDLSSAQAEASLARASAPVVEVSEPPPVTVADPYAVLGERVAEVLRTAEEHAQRITSDAEAAVERMLEEARTESTRLRDLAQEESDAMRQSAREQADATRRSAQEEADRVREDAAMALENARVEAESTIAGLSERRSVLAAELHATRSRLMGIVSQLEEDNEESLPAPANAVEAPTGLIPPDDPRRDPVPPDIPSFSPPPLPRVSMPRPQQERSVDQDERTVPERARVDGPDQEQGAMASESVGPEAIEVASLAEGAEADEGVVPPDVWGRSHEHPGLGVSPPDAGDDPTARAEEPTWDLTGPPAAEPADAEPHLAGTPEATNDAAADTGRPEATIAEPPDSGTPEGPAEEREPGAGAFPMWSREEFLPEGPPLDLTLPDFPDIDIPTLEQDDEDHRAS